MTVQPDSLMFGRDSVRWSCEAQGQADPAVAHPWNKFSCFPPGLWPWHRQALSYACGILPPVVDAYGPSLTIKKLSQRWRSTPTLDEFSPALWTIWLKYT